MQRDLNFPGPNERPIVYDLLLQEQTSPLIILVHGFKSYKNWGAYDLLARYFHDHGMNVCKFNFSHNGGTAEEVIDFPDLEAFGRNTFSKEMSDLRALLDHLVTTDHSTPAIDTDRIILLGHSRGGSIAALSAIEDDRIAGLITLNAVTDLKSYMSQFDKDSWRRDGVLFIQNGRTKQDMPLYYEFIEDFDTHDKRFDIYGRAGNLDVPCLIIHSKDDETVSHSQAMHLHELLPRSELVLLESGGHTLGAKQPWIDTKLPASLERAGSHILDFVHRISD